MDGSCDSGTGRALVGVPRHNLFFMYNLYFVYFCQIKQVPSFLPRCEGVQVVLINNQSLSLKYSSTPLFNDLIVVVNRVGCRTNKHTSC